MMQHWRSYIQSYTVEMDLGGGALGVRVIGVRIPPFCGLPNCTKKWGGVMHVHMNACIPLKYENLLL